MKNLLKKVALVLSFAMIFTAMPTTAFADTVVAKIVGGSEYSKFKDALTDANAMTDADVVVEIYGEVEFTDGMELKGNYNSITFVGEDAAAKMTIKQTAGGDYLEAHGKTVVFEDLILAKADPAWSGNSGHMGNYFSVQGGTITYDDCTFANGACTSGGTATYNNCTFNNTSEYGLWVYDDALVTVDGGTIDSAKGIKVYSEGEESVTSKLTVKNATFTENVTEKPAVAIGYAESVTLIGNTYNNPTVVLELDSGSDANCNKGITFTMLDANGTDISSTVRAKDRSNNDADCGVLVGGKIYPTVQSAKDIANPGEGDTVTMLFDSNETVVFPMGVILKKMNGPAMNVTVETPVATVNGTPFTSLQAAIDAANGAEVILIKETTENVTLNANANINLNSKTLTGKISVQAGVTATVQNGTIVNNDTDNAITSYGDLTTNNLNVKSVRHAIRIKGGKAAITGGKVELIAVTGQTQNAINIGDDETSADVEVTIDGVEAIGPKGTSSDSGAAVTVQKGAKVTIKNGTFTKGQNNTLAVQAGATLEIIGGKYDQDPTAYVAAGYHVCKDGDYYIVHGAEYKAKVPSTCSATGTEDYYVCEFGKMFEDADGTIEIQAPVTIDTLPHTPAADAAVAPGCTTTGLTAGEHCSVCGAVLTAQQTVPAAGHSFGGWYTVKEPICHDAGYEARMCQCGETESRPLAATTHNFDINGVCAICGLNKTTATVSAPSRANPNTGVHF